jgi:hypothetical protein
MKEFIKRCGTKERTDFITLTVNLRKQYGKKQIFSWWGTLNFLIMTIFSLIPKI